MTLTENQEQVFFCCRNLSSGTMATLTGENLYVRLDAIHAEFVQYVLKAFGQGTRFETWVDAWNEFKGKHPEYARENNMKKLVIDFCGIDSWNRPVFKALNRENYYVGDTDRLFNHGTCDDAVLDFYKDPAHLRNLLYFGNHFDCEPYGSKIDAVIELKH